MSSSRYPNLSDAERVTRLAAELGELGRRLAWARHELLSLPIAAAAPLAQPPAMGPAAVAGHATRPETDVEREPAPAAGSSAAADPGVGPSTVAGSSPTGAATSNGSDGLFSSRVLAWVGGSMTLIGVVLFLVLAAGRGWFGVPARLIVGAALGAALIQLGRWVYRRPGGEVGALALVGTGVAALYLDVGTATAKFHYLPGVVGLVCGYAVAGVGLLLADRWTSRALAAFVLIGVGVFLPAVTDGSLPLLVALVLVPQVASIPVARRNGWASTAIIGAAIPLVYGSVAAWNASGSWFFGDADAHGGRIAATTADVAVFVVGIACALVSSGTLSNRVLAWLVVSAPLPALQLAGALNDAGPGGHGATFGVVLATLVGLALITVAIAPRIPVPRIPILKITAHRSSTSAPAATPYELPSLVRSVAGAAGAVALFQATVLWLDGSALVGVLLGQSLVLSVLAYRLRHRGPLLGAGGYGLVGLFGALSQDAPISGLTSFPAYPYLVDGAPDHGALITGLSISLMTMLASGAFVAAAARLGWFRPAPLAWIPLGLVTLYGAAGVVVTAGLLIAPVQAGFVTAHAVVTISWTVVALLLLARGLTNAVPRISGLVLVAAAVAKLLLFDLVALDGLGRVAAFIGAGLVLLTAGARYARLVAQQNSPQQDAPQQNSRS